MSGMHHKINNQQSVRQAGEKHTACRFCAKRRATKACLLTFAATAAIWLSQTREANIQKGGTGFESKNENL